LPGALGYREQIKAVAEVKRDRTGTGRPPKQKAQENNSPQKIVASYSDDTNKTDHHRATQAGTNRTYIKTADNIVASGRY
jgi:hypothetical protein